MKSIFRGRLYPPRNRRTLKNARTKKYNKKTNRRKTKKEPKYSKDVSMFYKQLHSSRNSLKAKKHDDYTLNDLSKLLEKYPSQYPSQKGTPAKDTNSSDYGDIFTPKKNNHTPKQTLT